VVRSGNRVGRIGVHRVMRTRLLALVCGVLMLAGCGSASSPGVAGSAKPRPAPPVTASRGCPAAQVFFPFSAGALTGIQFVSPAQGWAVGLEEILATTDGGQRWTVQRSGRLNLTSVDFVSGQAGWAVGTSTLLATSDGGAHWAALPEPCPLIRSVHFISPETGFAVAGGTNVLDIGPVTPGIAGVVLATSDGGRSWRRLPSPADAQTVCFSDPLDGWLGADGRLYRTTDGGRSWVQAAAGVAPASAGDPATMIVQCAGPGSAWALDVGPGAAMSQEPHVGYHAGPDGTAPIFAEQYFPNPGMGVRANSPGGYAGPFSAISPSMAVFIDGCPACDGAGTAPWDLVTGSGAVLTPKGNVPGLNQPMAASFLSPQLGWVVGIAISDSGTGQIRQQQRIVFTDDGGRTWHVQYASPPAR
jgi:photosystem II stability/assembly factor-like uncharacterized protein